jgi:hypothetical protein
MIVWEVLRAAKGKRFVFGIFSHVSSAGLKRSLIENLDDLLNNGDAHCNPVPRRS